MASINIAGDTSGTVTLSAPLVAGSNTVTLPAATGTVSLLTQATAVTASGTSVDFTGIPSWAKRVTVMFSGVSTNGSSNLAIQVGDSGGIENTGYTGGSVTPSTQSAYNSSSYLLTGVNGAVAAYNGIITLALISGNIWVESGVISASASGYHAYSGGSKELSATLDRVRITTANGTDTFDAGSINVMWEG